MSKRKVLALGANVVGALLAVIVVVSVSATGGLGVPPLAGLLAPGGAWRLSPDSGTAHPESITMPGLAQEAQVVFEDNGLAHITTKDDADLFRVIGYVHARHRLGQMDLARRMTAGRLAEVVGEGGVDSDKFELELGLLRSAQRDWQDMAPDDPARGVLEAYAQGVNAARSQLIAQGRLPVLFKLLGYTPEPWTPVDSLLVQRSLTQTLSLSDQALRFADLSTLLPRDVFTDWFPAVAANTQEPYDKGPFRQLPLAALPRRADLAGESGPRAAAPEPIGRPSATALGPADYTSLRDRLAAMPSGAVHQIGNSNAWVVSGSRTASGEPMLAADPHLDYSLPSVWYQLEGRSPGYGFTGVTIPGIPLPLMGKTDRFAWAVTNSQRPTTLWYREELDPAQPDRYRWNGEWLPMEIKHYTITVKGGAPVTHDVRFTVHGPVLQMEDTTTALWWAGALPSANVRAVMDLLKAPDFAAARSSFRGWATPAVNILYADKRGNIGGFNVGVAPQVGPGGEIGLPLPGDGTADVVGSIPFDALPVAFNPPSGLIVTSNQREVSGAYPYQYSTSFNFVDQGWRASEIVQQIGEAGPLTMAESARMQSDRRDNLARQLMPPLLTALRGVQLDDDERKVADALTSWNYDTSGDSLLAQFFQIYNNRLVYVAIRPWWDKFNVPADPDVNVFADGGSYPNQMLRATVLSWIQRDPGNKYLSPPDGPRRTPNDVLLDAFRQTTKRMVELYGPPFDNWRYDLRMKVLFPSLLSPGVDRGPYAGGGTSRSINAAVGTIVRDRGAIKNTATGGPTWRFIVDWGTGQAESVMPAGQSENPLSPWYANGLPLWMAGEYWPVREGDAALTPTATTWRFSS